MYICIAHTNNRRCNARVCHTSYARGTTLGATLRALKRVRADVCLVKVTKLNVMDLYEVNVVLLQPLY